MTPKRATPAGLAAVAMMGAPAFTYTPHHHNGPVNGIGNVVNSGNTSILSGNTVNAPISAPVNICGTAIAILGFADASCVGGANVFFNSFNSMPVSPSNSPGRRQAPDTRAVSGAFAVAILVTAATSWSRGTPAVRYP